MRKTRTEYGSNADGAIVRSALVLAVIISVLLIVTMTYLIITKISGTAKVPDDDTPVEDGVNNDTENEGNDSTPSVKSPFKTTVENFYPAYAPDDQLTNLADAGLNSPNVALVDVSSNTIIASSKSKVQIYPASLTKVMTLIVVYENLTSESQLKDKLTLEAEVVDKMVAERSSGYGFRTGDVLTVEELIYAVILYSDGTACLTLANYIAGSEANFVKLMNDKATEMGLQNTLFQNSTGLHHVYHYSTCQDLAAIMMYAMKNPHCANVLTAQSYTFGSHFRPNSDGQKYTMYNQSLHTSKFTQPNTVKVTAAKTGYTDESGYCFVSYGKAKDGKTYILVTAGAPTVALRNQDTVTIYDKYKK